MPVVYVKEQGAYIRRMGERIVVTRNAQSLLDLPVFQMENIAVIGNVQVTTQALHLMMEKGIDVSFFSYGGRYIGHCASENSRNIFLRFEQYGYFLDEEKRLQMARKIVGNKIRNQIALLRTYNWTAHSHDWKSDIAQLKTILETLDRKQTTNELLGTEGVCSQIYFGAFGHMLKCDFSFHGRNRRPPRDPVNVILSLAYTFLTRELCGILDAESFEPYLGFLHGLRYGRKSLALDLIEEFRQPVIDRFVMMLFNKRMIGKHDFEFPENGAVVLAESGFRTFCKEYERWMNGDNTLSGVRSFRMILRKQVAGLKRAIQNGREYEPYAWKAD